MFELRLTRREEEQLVQASQMALELFQSYQHYRQLYFEAADRVTRLMAESRFATEYRDQVRRAREAEKRALREWETRGNKAAYESALSLINRLSSIAHGRLFPCYWEKREGIAEEPPVVSSNLALINAILLDLQDDSAIPDDPGTEAQRARAGTWSPRRGHYGTLSIEE